MIVNTLILGDVHLNNKIPGYLDFQVESLKRIIRREYGLNYVTFLGDIFDRRNPHTEELLAFKKVLDSFPYHQFSLIRGNHDTFRKNESTESALSLYESNHVKVYSDFYLDGRTKIAYIPHYAEEDKLKRFVQSVPEDFLILGHFSIVECKFATDVRELSCKDFKAKAILGHLHSPLEYEKVTYLGSLFSSSFADANLDNRYCILNKDGKISKKKVGCGIKHLSLDYGEIDWDSKIFKDKKFFVLLRAFLKKLDSDVDYKEVVEKMKGLNLPYFDIKFYPTFNVKDIKKLRTEKGLFSLTDEVINNFIDSVSSEFSKEELLQLFNELKNESQTSKNS